MNYTKYFLISILTLTTFSSCDFSEDNLSDDATSEASVSDLFNPAITQIATNQSDIMAWTPGLLIKYYESIYLYNHHNIYNSFANIFWDKGLYGGSLKYASDLEEIADKDNNADLKAISIILQVNEFLHATTLFGDIPFTEALKGVDNQFPVYDTQETIYQELLSMSDEAITLIGETEVNNALADTDILFKGNMSKWKQFASALQARMHLHLSSKTPSEYEKLLTAVDKSFQSIEDQANFTWNLHNLAANPLHEFNLQRPASLHINENYATNLIDRGDPRMELTTRFDSTKNYWAFQQFSPYIFHWTASNTTLPLFSYAELQFMKAEALLMVGASDDDVANALRKGIEASCQQMGIDPAAYLEFAQNQSALESFVTKDEKLKHIITEAYYSYYGYAIQQAWNNYKRLGIPNFAPDGSSSGINPSGSVPVRLPYPESELELNSENMEDAIARQNGALLDKPLWIFSK